MLNRVLDVIPTGWRAGSAHPGVCPLLYNNQSKQQQYCLLILVVCLTPPDNAGPRNPSLVPYSNRGHNTLLGPARNGLLCEADDLIFIGGGQFPFLSGMYGGP